MLQYTKPYFSYLGLGNKMNDSVIMQILPGPEVISQHDITGNLRNNTLNQSEHSVQNHVTMCNIGR